MYKAFLITEYESPAEISETSAPSFWDCFTLEFIKTVHLDPRSTGAFENKASFAKSSTFILRDFAKLSINEPHPDEHASFNNILSIAPFFIFRHFISWPPISKMKSTPGKKKSAAL